MRTLVLCLAFAFATSALCDDYTTSVVGARRGKLLGAVSHYPQFSKKTPLNSFANQLMTSEAKRLQAAFMKEANEALAAPRPEMPPLTYTMKYTVTRYSDRFISVQFHEEYYLGGAHGAQTWSTYNLGLVGGKPKRLQLDDLFVAGGAHRRSISDLVIKKLMKREGAMWVANGEVKELNAEQFERFTVAKDGITFYFNPYEMGPYSSGSFKVTLGLSELGMGFRREVVGMK
jgi:hypothetical protein